MRLEALWHAWEAQWPQPAQRVAWLRNGLDHQLAVIMSEDGPLRECSGYENQHQDADALAAKGSGVPARCGASLANVQQ